MSLNPSILSGLSDIAGQYDALICDIWGVLHNGERAFAPAVEALRRYRAGHGMVVLLTNAPRPSQYIQPQLRSLGVTDDSYDAIVTSGGAARADLFQRQPLSILHLGPERDETLFEGLDVKKVGPDEAELALCTGLFDDDTETPEDYRELFAKMLARELPMICANPDVIVQRGSKLIYCAGGLAHAYQELGGKVAWYGKPYAPIYAAALEAAGHPSRPLVVGDGVATDIKGANEMGFDALFVMDGIHVADIPVRTPEGVAAFLGSRSAHAQAAVGALSW
jgi:HAD superfamily hydrolase (TIGR01459 family)